MNSNGKFLTFEEFQNKFEIKANYLHHFQLIAATPPDLKRKAFGSTVPGLLGATSEYCQVRQKRKKREQEALSRACYCIRDSH